jgi:hypothetical protein
MNEKDHRELKDILSDAHLHETPYKIPDGYFDDMEDEVHARIKEEEGTIDGAVEENIPGWKKALRPALGLLCSFLLIFAFAYGIFALTGTLNVKKGPAAAAASSEEEEFVNADKGILRTINLADYEQFTEEYPEEAADSLSEEDIVNYLTDGNFPIYVLADME